MFDVEAVKLAARSNGFEVGIMAVMMSGWSHPQLDVENPQVIDVEPKPLWQESEVRAMASARWQQNGNEDTMEASTILMNCQLCR